MDNQGQIKLITETAPSLNTEGLWVRRGEATATSTTCTIADSWKDIAALTSTVTTEGGDIYVMAFLTGYDDNGATATNWRARVDVDAGASQPVLSQGYSSANTAEVRDLTQFVKVVGLSAGSHTFKIQALAVSEQIKFGDASYRVSKMLVFEELPAKQIGGWDGWPFDAITVRPIAGEADYETVAAAVAGALDGQSIVVGPGTYTDRVTIVDKTLYIKFLPGAFIRYSGTSYDAFRLEGDADGSIIEGLDLDRTGVNAGGSSVSLYLYDMEDASDWGTVFRNCDIKCTATNATGNANIACNILTSGGHTDSDVIWFRECDFYASNSTNSNYGFRVDNGDSNANQIVYLHGGRFGAAAPLQWWCYAQNYAVVYAIGVTAGSGDWFRHSNATFWYSYFNPSGNRLYLASDVHAREDGNEAIDAAGAGLRARHYVGTVEDGFEGSTIPAGWAWAGAPFSTPPTVTVSSSVLACKLAASTEAFLYKSFQSGDNNRMSMVGLQSNYATVQIGIRLDDGSDNNYASCILEITTGVPSVWQCRVKYRTGGGAINYVNGSSHSSPSPAYVQYGSAGTRWTNWGVSFTIGGSEWGRYLPFYQTSNSPSGLTFTPTREGLYFNNTHATNTWFNYWTDFYHNT
jgi:hypothetical protein